MPAILLDLNSIHRNINFSYESEIDGQLHFLDVNIQFCSGKFITTTYTKPTNTGLHTLWSNFTPKLYKTNLLICLLQRSFRICNDWANFISEVDHIQNTFTKIGYPRYFVQNISKSFIDIIFSEKLKTYGPEFKCIFVKLPYLGKFSARIKRDLIKIFKDYRPHLKLCFISYSSNKIGNLFRKLLGQIPFRYTSNAVYKITCACGQAYIGQTCHRVQTESGSIRMR